MDSHIHRECGDDGFFDENLWLKLKFDLIEANQRNSETFDCNHLFKFMIFFLCVFFNLFLNLCLTQIKQII